MRVPWRSSSPLNLGTVAVGECPLRTADTVPSYLFTDVAALDHFPSVGASLVPRPLPILSRNCGENSSLFHSCEIKSGSGLGTRLLWHFLAITVARVGLRCGLELHSG